MYEALVSFNLSCVGILSFVCSYVNMCCVMVFLSGCKVHAGRFFEAASERCSLHSLKLSWWMHSALPPPATQLLAATTPLPLASASNTN